MIINHFEDLINRVNIDIEQSIENYNEDQMLGKLKCFRIGNRNIIDNSGIDLEYFDSNESSEKTIKWSEETTVIDYLNQVRQKTIDELKKAQEDSLGYLKLCDLDELRKDSKNSEEMKSRLFAEKFYFQVLYKHRQNQISWVFNLYTLVVDFYLSQSEINYLEYLFNCEENKIRKSSSDCVIFDDVRFQVFYEIFY